jgi:UDP-N-acetylmuramate dehydrogenase
MFYEPESKEELTSLCRDLYKRKEDFLIIGHTSNIYFTPDYHANIIVSTRKVKDINISDDSINVDCGVSVRSLSRRMVDLGIKGFYGLIDLPGTVGAAVYGNASCFNCSITKLLISRPLKNI